MRNFWAAMVVAIFVTSCLSSVSATGEKSAGLKDGIEIILSRAEKDVIAEEDQNAVADIKSRLVIIRSVYDESLIVEKEFDRLMRVADKDVAWAGKALLATDKMSLLMDRLAMLSVEQIRPTKERVNPKNEKEVKKLLRDVPLITLETELLRRLMNNSLALLEESMGALKKEDKKK